ncbi:MAG: DUF2129 domain-containing protein [Bacilli bacterium]|nr:DUF2129 domain-containing protein [Bacilli bacterium]
MVKKRKSVIVYFRSPKAVKQIAEFGEIKYYTKKGKYAIIYLNEEDIESVSEQLGKLKLVRRVEESLQDDSEYQLDFSVKEKDLTT